MVRYRNIVCREAGIAQLRIRPEQPNHSCLVVAGIGDALLPMRLRASVRALCGPEDCYYFWVIDFDPAAL